MSNDPMVHQVKYAIAELQGLLRRLEGFFKSPNLSTDSQNTFLQACADLKKTIAYCHEAVSPIKNKDASRSFKP